MAEVVTTPIGWDVTAGDAIVRVRPDTAGRWQVIGEEGKAPVSVWDSSDDAVAQASTLAADLAAAQGLLLAAEQYRLDALARAADRLAQATAAAQARQVS